MLKNNSFSLIELLVSISIIAILAGMVIGGLGAINSKTMISDTKGTILLIDNAMKEYKEDHGEYPFTSSVNLGNPSASEEVILKTLTKYGAEDFVDSWGNGILFIPVEDYGKSSEPEKHALTYTLASTTTEVYYNQNSFQLISSGEDQSTGGSEDNVANFNIKQ